MNKEEVIKVFSSLTSEGKIDKNVTDILFDNYD